MNVHFVTLKSCFDAAILVWQEPNMNLWDLINQWNECRGPMHYDVTANCAARSSPSTATLSALAKVAWIALSRSSPWMNLVLRCQQHWELFCVSSRNLGYLSNTEQPNKVKTLQNNQRQTPQKIKVNLSVLPAAVMVRTPHTQYPQIFSTLTLGGDYPHTWLKLEGEGYMKDRFLEHHWKYHPISPNTFSAAHEETKTLLPGG